MGLKKTLKKLVAFIKISEINNFENNFIIKKSNKSKIETLPKQ